MKKKKNQNKEIAVATYTWQIGPEVLVREAFEGAAACKFLCNYSSLLGTATIYPCVSSNFHSPTGASVLLP